MNRIIFQKISSCFRAARIVDGDNIQIRSVKKPPKTRRPILPKPLIATFVILAPSYRPNRK